MLVALPRAGAAQAGASSPLRVLNVPFVSQSEALCGGAAAAMVLRFWGERGVDAESFAPLVDRRAGGIRTTDLLKELERRGWTGLVVPGSEARLADEIARNGRPVLVLLEDRPGTYHYVVVVGAPERGFIFHDPARTPYRVLTREEFVARWRPTSMWMALVAPARAAAPPEAAASRVSAPATACDETVAAGVRFAQSGDYGEAETRLVSALSCPGGAAYRELAGLRALQKRWNDAASLAETAVQADASDAYAWRLLATARFLQDDRGGALQALNRAGEPAIDTLQVDGLRRTRARVIEDALDIERGEVLTPGTLDRARRRLGDVPALRSGTLDYTPVPGGRAEVKAIVRERHLLPSGADYAPMAVRGIFSRDLRIPFGSLTGGGEAIHLQYRFRPGRPRLAATLEAPAPWGGVWSVHGSWERQPFEAFLPTSERTTGRLAWSDWLTGRFKVSVRGGADKWQDIGTRGALGGTAYAATLDDRVSARLDVDGWAGETSFSMVKAIGKFRSTNVRRGPVLVASAGAGVAADDTPAESWFAGDSGNARPGPVFLRAHGLVESGQFFRIDQMGRSIVHGSVEGQYWWPLARPAAPGPPGAPARSGRLSGMLDQVSMGVAVFVDSARVTRRLLPGDRNDVDAGAGLRLGLPGGNGFVRVDVARGLVHHDNKISFGFEP